MINYPIGMRGEAVEYTITTTCYGLVKLLERICDFGGENDGVYYLTLDGYSVDVVDLVHKAQTFTDGKTEISYCILDTDEQDWAATITIKEGKITDVLEEAVEI